MPAIAPTAKSTSKKERDARTAQKRIAGLGALTL